MPATPTPRRALFPRISHHVAHLAGRPETFIGACAVIVLWLASGFFVGFSDTWQLVINTGTTIVTFLMVFVIQDSQNRDTAALHLKIDELLRATGAAKNELIDLDQLTQDELDELLAQYSRIARQGTPPPSKAKAKHKKK